MAKNPFFSKFSTKIDSLDSGSINSYIHLLSKEHGMLEALFDSIGEGIIVVDDSLRIVYYNTVGGEIFGIPKNHKNVRITSFVKGVDFQELLESASGSDRTASSEVEIFYPVRRVLRFYALPRQQASLPPGVEKHEEEELTTLIFNDITQTYDRLNSAAANERSQLISLLAAEVAHEIGNPLNSIYLHLQLFQRLLASGDFDKEEALAMTGEARSEVERLDNIIHRFLQALRPAKLQLEVLDLKGVLLETLNFMRPEIEGRSVTVNCLWSESLPKIRGDAEQLKQAFYNLIKNAVQAMPQGGTLTISCNYDDRSVLAAFSDKGSGIKREDAARIFTPHFTTKEKGNGIGLMVVERIVREHGGRISFASTVGEGTKFVMAFPRADVRCRVLPGPAESETDEKKKDEE